MDNKQIIIILLVVIVALAAAIGFVLFNQATAKEQTIVKITSDSKQTEGGALSVKLTDLSDNPIAKEIVSVKITDKNGKVVSSGKKSGYDISLNKESVTLSPTNADESIVLTNNVRDGSVAAANLTNPSSGFAGDASALAEAQALSNGEVTASKPTGDDTPYEPFALTAGISAAIIFLLLALLMAKKKLLPGQKTKQS